MSAPAEVLLAQALHALEGAQLQITAGRYSDAADSIGKAAELIRKVVQ